MIFCFIYKFRTRFMVVAQEILHRLLTQAEGTGKTLSCDLVQNFTAACDIHKFSELVEQYRQHGLIMDDLKCCSKKCGAC